MGNDRYFADIYVHLHPASVSNDREKVERELCDSCGVFSVHFDADETRDAMVVAYNPEAVSCEDLLEIIRSRFASAVSVANVLTSVSTE